MSAAEKAAESVWSAIETIKQTGGAVEISGVRIEPCDEYGQPATAPSEEGPPNDLPTEDVEALTSVVRAVTDLWDEPLDEVHDVPPLVNAVLASDWLATHDAQVRADERARLVPSGTSRTRSSSTPSGSRRHRLAGAAWPRAVTGCE